MLTDGSYNVNDNKDNILKTFFLCSVEKSMNDDTLKSVRPSKNNI